MVFRFLLAVLVVCLPAFSLAKPWEKAIDDVHALAETYKAEVMRQTGNNVTYYLGTMHHPMDWQMHMCAILGRRLGFADQISHLEPPQPPLRSDPQLLAENYISLSNWITAAQKFSGISQHQRATYWNNECIGNMGTPSNLWVPVPKEVFFSVSYKTLIVYGDIVAGFSDRLRAALLQNPTITNVGLGSGGGNVGEAIRAGLMLRGAGYTTQLMGACKSACPLVFLGGVNRSVFRGSYGSERFGFHKISENGVAIANDDPTYGIVYQYVQEMGGHADMILTAMQMYETNQMGFFSFEVECPMRIATWYQGYFPGECAH